MFSANGVLGFTALLVQFAAAMVATMSFGITFQVPRRHYFACGATGAVGWLCYLVCAVGLGLSAPVATLLAALPLTAMSRLFAITNRAPLTLFLLCGIFPLVPGAGIYYSAYYFLRDEGELCTDKAVETIKIAVALALGIALVCSIPLPRNISLHQYNGRKEKQE